MVIIRRVTRKDHQRCVQLFTKAFFQDESILSRLGYNENQVLKWAIADKEDSLNSGLSWLAEDKENNIIGVRFSKPFTFKQPKKVLDPIAALVHKMIEKFVNAHSRVLLPESKILYHSGTAVSKEYRRQGLASLLTKASLSLAIELGYERAFVLATSDAVVRLYTRNFGFTALASERFKDFKFNGNTPWSHVGPNESIVLLERSLRAFDSINLLSATKPIKNVDRHC